MVKGRREKFQLHALLLSITLVLVYVVLWVLYLSEITTFAELIAILIAFVSIFIVWHKHIVQLEREYTESVWYQHQLLLTLNTLMVWTLLYVSVKHEKERWIEDISCLLDVDTQTKYDVKRLRNLLAGTHENFQLDMSVLQSNHYIQPHIRDFNSEFRRTIRHFFTFDDENYLLIVKESIERLLLLGWWIKNDDPIKAQYDKLSELNTMLDKMTTELLG